LTIEFAYNGDGARTRKTVGGHTTQYALDLATTLPVVISDTEAVYLYGLDILAQQQAERLYYMHDGLGSVRQLLDSTGQIETSYAYDPFGVPVMGGDGSNPYQFTGEAWDAEVELLYLRARYYQPEVGRFIARDPWMGDLRRPGLLNPYGYVGCNPVSRIDRTGLECEGPGCPCPTVTPTAGTPECVPTGSVAPGMTPGTEGASVAPTPVALPYATWEAPSPWSLPTAAAPVPCPTSQTPPTCRIPTVAHVPTPVPTPFAEYPLYTGTPPPTPTSRIPPFYPRGVPVPERLYCPDPEANFRRARQLYAIADWIDVTCFGIAEAGGADAIAILIVLVSTAKGVPVDPATAHTQGEAIVMFVPEAVIGYLRSLGDCYREACE
jgi:RHS repeat-associated protein